MHPLWLVMALLPLAGCLDSEENVEDGDLEAEAMDDPGPTTTTDFDTWSFVLTPDAAQHQTYTLPEGVVSFHFEIHGTVASDVALSVSGLPCGFQGVPPGNVQLAIPMGNKGLAHCEEPPAGDYTVRVSGLAGLMEARASMEHVV